jgi:hypothetical protein
MIDAHLFPTFLPFLLDLDNIEFLRELPQMECQPFTLCAHTLRADDVG